MIAGGCVLMEGEPHDSARAKAQAGPHAMIALHNAIEAEERGFARRPQPAHIQPLVEKYRELYNAYQPADARYLANHRGHLMFVRPEESHLCTADLIDATTFTGTRAELVDKLRALRDAGYDHFSITIRHGRPEMLEEWADLFEGL